MLSDQSAQEKPGAAQTNASNTPIVTKSGRSPHRIKPVGLGSEPPNAGAATWFFECPLNPPFVKSGNLSLFSLLAVFASVDVLGAVIAIFRRNGGTEPTGDQQIPRCERSQHG